jgi:hypothetical protein
MVRSMFTEKCADPDNALTCSSYKNDINYSCLMLHVEMNNIWFSCVLNILYLITCAKLTLTLFHLYRNFGRLVEIAT